MSEIMETNVKRLSAGTVYRLVGLGLVCSVLPFSLLMGFSALFGGESVTWNGKPITGVAGLLASPVIGLFVAGIFTLLMGTAMAFGLWVYSFLRPLRIVYRAANDTEI